MEPGVSQTFGPMVLTGRGPLCRRASRTRKSESPSFVCLMLPAACGNQRLKGFHENEPDMHAGGVLPCEWFFVRFIPNYILTQIILMSI